MNSALPGVLLFNVSAYFVIPYVSCTFIIVLLHSQHQFIYPVHEIRLSALIEYYFFTLFTGRGKKKKIKMLLPLLLLFKLKAAALIPLALGALALLAFKAVIISKIALVLALIIGVQKLLAHKAAQTQSYEVVAHPHYTEDHHSGHYAAARSLDAAPAQKLAYAAHEKSE